MRHVEHQAKVLPGNPAVRFQAGIAQGSSGCERQQPDPRWLQPEGFVGSPSTASLSGQLPSPWQFPKVRGLLHEEQEKHGLTRGLRHLSPHLRDLREKRDFSLSHLHIQMSREGLSLVSLRSCPQPGPMITLGRRGYHGWPGLGYAFPSVFGTSPEICSLMGTAWSGQIHQKKLLLSRKPSSRGSLSSRRDARARSPLMPSPWDSQVIQNKALDESPRRPENRVGGAGKCLHTCS